MKVYAPEFLPGNTVAFKNHKPTGIEVVIATVNYCVFNADNGYRYHLTGWVEPFIADELTLLPDNVAPLHTEFEVK